MHHLVSLRLQTIQCLCYSDGTVLYGAERLIHKSLVILAIGQSALAGFINVIRELLRRESDLRFDDRPYQRFLRTVQFLPDTFDTELGPFEFLQHGLREEHILQSELADGFQSKEIACDHTQDLRYRSHLETEIRHGICYAHRILADLVDACTIFLEHIVIECRYTCPRTRGLFRGDSLCSLLHRHLRGDTVIADDEGIRIYVLSQMEIRICLHSKSILVE